MATSETSICQMALARIGAKSITTLTDGSVAARQCTIHYEQTRDALLRSHFWRFASSRSILSQDATDPAFQWANQFILPTDFSRLKAVFEDNNTRSQTTGQSFVIEGQRLLTNDTAVSIRYVKEVTDPGQFDSLFVEVLVLTLAIKMVMPLSQNKVLRRDLQDELKPLMSQVRTIDRQETNTIRTAISWNESRQIDGLRNDKRSGA